MNRLRPATEQGKVTAHNSQPDNRAEGIAPVNSDNNSRTDIGGVRFAGGGQTEARGAKE